MRVNILTFATPIAKNERFLPEFSTLSSGYAGSAGSGGNGTWMAGPDPPTTRAGGQDDVSYNKLPQITIISINIMIIIITICIISLSLIHI